MEQGKEIFYRSIAFSTSLISILYIIKFSEIIFKTDFASLGLYPRESGAIYGIALSPLLHSNLNHLISNSFPLLILTFALLFFYPTASKKVFSIIYFFTGAIVWIIGRPAYHIGASGLVYGLICFFFFSGIFRFDTRSISLSLIVVFLYGGLVWGILPLGGWISWESHLAGACVGTICAFIFRKFDPPKKYDWENEDDYSEESGTDEKS